MVTSVERTPSDLENFLAALKNSENATAIDLLNSGKIAADRRVSIHDIDGTLLKTVLDAKNEEVALALISNLNKLHYKNNPEKIIDCLEYDGVNYASYAKARGLYKVADTIEETIKTNKYRNEVKEKFFDNVSHNNIAGVKESLHVMHNVGLGINATRQDLTGLEMAVQGISGSRVKLVDLLLDGISFEERADPTAGYYKNALLPLIASGSGHEKEASLILDAIKTQIKFKGLFHLSKAARMEACTYARVA